MPRVFFFFFLALFNIARAQPSQSSPEQIPTKKKFIVTLKTQLDTFKKCKDARESNDQTQNRYRCRKIFRSGFSTYLDAVDVDDLIANDADVLDVEEDFKVYKNAVPWHLDRLDQTLLPLDNYEPAFRKDKTRPNGKGVTVFILDTGVNGKHVELKGRVLNMVTALDPEEDDLETLDPDGHGSFCASLVAGENIGLAPEAKIVSVRVLNSEGAGSVSDVVAGLEWTTDQILATSGKIRAVALLALGAPSGVRSRALENAVDRFTRETNALLITAAGNQNEDACKSTPAKSERAFTVAATDERDSNYEWNNMGRCVDAFAPGVRLVGACVGNNRCVQNDSGSAYGYQSGTSMAAAIAAGAAARVLTENPDYGAEEVKGWLIKNSTKGIVRIPEFALATSNRLLRVF